MMLLWAVCAVCALLGGALMFFGVMAAKGAPQEAAAAAVGIGLAVIPYIFVRSISLAGALTQEKVKNAVLAALREHGRGEQN